jgi:hypothetical protein
MSSSSQEKFNGVIFVSKYKMPSFLIGKSMDKLTTKKFSNNTGIFTSNDYIININQNK